MTEGNGGAAPDAPLERRWDVALSFAGAQRDYVEKVAEALKARGLRCFYDADEQTELWGRYLADELPAIYGEQAATVVMFVSAEYAAREWTRLERQATLARAMRERREYVLPARFDDTPLPGLPSDMVTVNLRTRTPRQFAAVIADKLAALAALPAAPADAGGLARTARSARPAGVMRVSEADPRRLGVHAAISVPGVPDEALPEYVRRDVDAGVRATVTAAEERGGFVLLVGGSSVGKTRSAVEAAKALLPGWWLVHPAGPDQVAALAPAPPPRTVVWLDELQRYLDGEHGLTGGVVRALLNAPHPAVIIATLWPDLYAAYTAARVPGAADPHAREREVLDLAAVIRIGPAFSPAEQDRARAAADRDPRLAVALGAAGYGLTQTLAAAPHLVARWEDAQTASPYAWAVLTAALDVARLGAHFPLTADLLRAAAPGYCTSQQRAEAPGNWFEQGLAYATAKLHGAASALSPIGAGMGQVAGYTPADYLIQHASRERRSARVPVSTWDVILSHIRDPDDATRLAGSARDRLLYRYAIPLYWYAADAGNRYATRCLVDLLDRRGDLDEALPFLRARADAGDGDAAVLLADLLLERGDLDELRARANAGDRAATWRLADLLAARGGLDEAVQILRAPADAGDELAAVRLADLLAERGGLDEAVQILRAPADAGNRLAAVRLAGLLAARGGLDGLQARADADDQEAAVLLADLLAERGDLDEAVQILRSPADAGSGYAAGQLARLLAARGDLDELRARADAGDQEAVWRLDDLLTERGDLDELRARADAGDRAAVWRLVRLLTERSRLDEAVQILRATADAGDRHAAGRLARLLSERGDLDELRARADARDREAASRLADLLKERGDLDGLRARADAGDREAASRLADLLKERGDLDGLRARADAGDREAVWRLADVLTEPGDLDEAVQILRAPADAGDELAAERLADLLAERGDLNGLRARADAGDRKAASRLADVLTERGDLDEAVQILRAAADAGDELAAERLADLLAELGDLNGLRARVAAGDREAAVRLADLLVKQDPNEAKRLRRFGLNPDGSTACA